MNFIYITKQYDYLFKLTIEFIHYLQKFYKYIGYLHSYCHNEQQNKDNLITYQKKYDTNFYTTITFIIRLHMLLTMNKKIKDTFLLKY